MEITWELRGMDEIYEKYNPWLIIGDSHTQYLPLSFLSSPIWNRWGVASIKNNGIFKRAMPEIKQIYCFFCQQKISKVERTSDVVCGFTMSLRTQTLSTLLFLWSIGLLSQGPMWQLQLHPLLQIPANRKEEGIKKDVSLYFKDIYRN